MKITNRQAASTATENFNIYIPDFRIVYDTREQLPWMFEDILMSKKLGGGLLKPILDKETIKTGDYTIAGLEKEFTIERKSLSDLRSSATGGRDRFQREHEAMQSIIDSGGYACVIVESPIQDLITEADPKFMSVEGTRASWQIEYKVPWFFEASRHSAQRLAWTLMYSFWRKTVERQRKMV